MDVADALDAFLADDDERFEVPAEPMTLEDDQAVNRMLRRRGRLERKISKIDAQCDAEIAEIETFRARMKKGPLGALEWVNRSLEAFARVVQSADEKRKTITVRSGVLRLRDAQPRMVVDAGEKEKLVAFIEARKLDLVEYEAKIDNAGLKKRLTIGPPTGEAIDADGFMPHCAVLHVVGAESGEDESIVVPGVTFLKRAELGFSASTTDLAAVAGHGHNGDDEATEPQGDKHDG